MSSKRPALDMAALGAAAGETHNPVTKLKHQTKGTSKTREGKVQIQGFYPPAYRKTIKMLASREDTTVEALLQEGMDHLFKKYKIEMAS